MGDIAQAWRKRSDDELLSAAEVLGDYTPEAREAILEELRRRGVTAPTADVFEADRVGLVVEGGSSSRQNEPGEWREVRAQAGRVLLECVQCGHGDWIPLSDFFGGAEDGASRLRPSEEELPWGRPVFGLVTAFGIAFVVAAVVAGVLGLNATLASFVAVLLFLALRPILVPAMMSKLGVWNTTCSRCGVAHQVAVEQPKAGNTDVVAVSREAPAPRAS